jgi:anionic cell wall polymer biosynthesis LytR-Cps2A-Psr (LCP) family protein
MRGSGVGSAVLGKAGYATACLACAAVLIVAGYAHSLVSLTRQLAGGASIGDSSSVGAMNILLMGLESRTNFKGQNLTSHQLNVTHSGKESAVQSGTQGSQDTDTLILIHVFAGGQKAVGYSIPRDDVVNFPHATFDGITEGKIDGAYAYAYDQYVSDNVGKMSSNALYLGANQAGQAFEVQTVESVTGVHIDHFVVSNIYGFYLLAGQFGGIEACIKPAPAQGGFPAGANLTDIDTLVYPPTNNSNFNAYQDGYNKAKGGAQYLHLDPEQSLAFVRSRDTLPGVDVGRTHRQQAALDYIIWKLKNQNLLDDPNVISGMLSDASQFLLADQNFNLLDFATNMKALTGSHLSLTTLPDAAVQNIMIPAFGRQPQDANYIYVPDIQQIINGAFYGSAMVKPTKALTVDVYNGSGTPGLAGEAAQAFATLGYTPGKAANPSAQAQTVQDDSQVFYGPGAEQDAGRVADEVGALAATSLSSLPAGHVEVLLGSQVTALPAGLETFGGATVSAQDFITAAEQDSLPAAELPPVTTGSTPAAGTQSVNSVLFGAGPQAPGRHVTNPAPQPSKHVGSSADGVTVPASARYGIPCVY